MFKGFKADHCIKVAVREGQILDSTLQELNFLRPIILLRILDLDFGQNGPILDIVEVERST